MPGGIYFSFNDVGNSVELIFKAVSSNEYSYYFAPTKYPNIGIHFEQSALRDFLTLGDLDLSNSQIAGWLNYRADLSYDQLDANGNLVVLGEVFVDVIEYTYTSQMDDINLSVQDILSVSSTLVGFEAGSINYPNGETLFATWKDQNKEDEPQLIRQCINVGEKWSCGLEQPLKEFSCTGGTPFGEATGSMESIMEFLSNQGCLDRVTIDGRGYFKLLLEAERPFKTSRKFDARNSAPIKMGLQESALRLVTRFSDLEGVELHSGVINFIAQFLSSGEIAINASIADGYRSATEANALGFTWVVPIGEKVLWVSVGNEALQGSNSTTDDLMYYIQDGNVTIALRAFREGVYDKDVGFIRYDGNVIGTVHKEGELYIVRYEDNSWQLL